MLVLAEGKALGAVAALYSAVGRSLPGPFPRPSTLTPGGGLCKEGRSHLPLQVSRQFVAGWDILGMQAQHTAG